MGEQSVVEHEVTNDDTIRGQRNQHRKSEILYADCGVANKML